MGAGVVTYEQISMDRNLPFDDLITITEGSVRIHSDGKTFELSAGDLAWFPAQAALTYEVAEKVTKLRDLSATGRSERRTLTRIDLTAGA
jgi:ethanolamine utilization protein EutQ (cupin superfamily)